MLSSPPRVKMEVMPHRPLTPSIRLNTWHTRNGRQLGVLDRLMRHLWIAGAEYAVARHVDVQLLLHRRADVDFGQDPEALIRERFAGARIDLFKSRAGYLSVGRVAHFLVLHSFSKVFDQGGDRQNHENEDQDPEQPPKSHSETHPVTYVVPVHVMSASPGRLGFIAVPPGTAQRRFGERGATVGRPV